VAAQPEIRVGIDKRLTILFPDRLCLEAQQFGWAEPFRNKKDQLHWSFLPQLLPAFVEFYQGGLELPPKQIQIAVVGAGLVDAPDEAASVRARQATTRLIRSARFGKTIVTAYDKKCAMCGLNFGLVSGAHILPVSAPTSTDHPTNGVALCENHHRAFDRHLIHVHPAQRTIRLHPSIVARARHDAQTQAFVNAMYGTLVAPADPSFIPTQRMFEERYIYYKDDYKWVK